MLAQRFGENRWTLGGWAIVLIVFGILSLQAVVGKGESGCEKFVRAVLADRGDRKLIVSDGIFDDFFRVLSPEGVRVIGTRTNKDREFLLNIFDGGESFTNKALLVRRYYNLPEMALAAAELGFRRRSQPKAPERAAEKTVIVTQEMTKSNMVERLTQAAEPLAKTLTEIETELAKPTGKQNRDVLLRGQQELRATWRQGVFRGTRLSNAVLLADIMLGDLVALESDAITALMIDREDPAANGALGSIRQEQGRFESAERYLRKGVKGGGVFAMGKLAILLIQTKRPAEAVEWAEKAVKLAPTDISLREPLAAALVECGRLDEADAAIREIARQAVATDTIIKETPFLAGVRKRLAAKRKEAGMKETGK